MFEVRVISMKWSLSVLIKLAQFIGADADADADAAGVAKYD